MNPSKRPIVVKKLTNKILEEYNCCNPYITSRLHLILKVILISNNKSIISKTEFSIYPM